MISCKFFETSENKQEREEQWLDEVMQFIFEVGPGCLISGTKVSAAKYDLDGTLAGQPPVNWLR
jgi:hypothetical protein